VRAWLAANHPKQLALLDHFELELRLGRLTTSSTAAARSSALPTSEYGGMFGASDRRLVTSRTLELLKSLIGATRWKNAAQLLLLLRGLGRELHSVGGFREPAIGNLVRRVMAAVREEAVVKNSPTDRLSLQSMLWVHPQHIKPTRSQRRSDSFSDMDSFHTDLPASFYANRPDLKQAVMEAIQEIMTDLEDMHKNIDEQATNHIHAGEIVLTYGRSKTVEMVRCVECTIHVSCSYSLSLLFHYSF
jgi:translation initiation factor eIF-2B subunit beta